MEYEEDANLMTEEEAEAVQEVSATGLPDAKNEQEMQQDGTDRLVMQLQSDFRRAKKRREADEERWLQAYRNFRGIYGPDVAFSDEEKSKVFIKITKSKVMAAYGQITDVLLSGTKIPISIQPTPEPTGIAEAAHVDPSGGSAGAVDDPYGFKGDGREFPAGATRDSLELGPFSSLLGEDAKEGAAKRPDQIEVSPAQEAARKAEKKIHDQLGESNAGTHLRRTAFEAALLGTGIIKGPFAVPKEYPKWEDDGTYAPEKKIVPVVEQVSIWNCYPDPDAVDIESCNFFFQREAYTTYDLRKLKDRPHFRGEVIDWCIDQGTDWVKEDWESELDDNDTERNMDRFEVLECWGIYSRDLLDDIDDIQWPDDVKLENVKEVYLNVWMCRGQVIRLQINPYRPFHLPYMAVPYEVNPYSFFGVGVAENMDDTQTLMNGFMRMSVDNAVLSGNLVFEVDETQLASGEDFKVYAGKVFRRTGGAMGQSLFAHKFPNVTGENMQMFDKARMLADESTGIPSFSHGQTGVSGVGRTASGISMLMGAASLSIKTVIKNFDDYLLKPLGRKMYFFNRQFNVEEAITGDLEVKAGGVAALMANEVRSQRLLQFLQVAGSNQMLAPYVKFGKILRSLAMSLDLDPDDVVFDEAEMKKKKMEMEQEAAMQQQQAGPQAAGPLPVNDQTGGGGSNIGVGAAPMPNEEGFTGSEQAPQ